MIKILGRCKFEFYLKDEDIPFYRLEIDGCEKINDAGMIEIAHAVNTLMTELKKRN